MNNDEETKVPTYQKDLADCTLEETIERLAAVNYSFKEMAIYVDMEPQEFKKEATTEDSKIWLAIQRGKLQAQFEINDKLAANARSGNITAAQIYAKNCEMKDVENLKQRIFYGE